MTTKRDYYGVDKKVLADEIKSAYRKFAMQFQIKINMLMFKQDNSI